MDNKRFNQLVAGGFAYWIYCVGDPLACPGAHVALDGIALPSGHPFWKRFLSPVGPECRCYIVGARSEAGVRRLGGDPDKKLPQWWEWIDPTTGKFPA